MIHVACGTPALQARLLAWKRGTAKNVALGGHWLVFLVGQIARSAAGRPVRLVPSRLPLTNERASSVARISQSASQLRVAQAIAFCGLRELRWFRGASTPACWKPRVHFRTPRPRRIGGRLHSVSSTCTRYRCANGQPTALCRSDRSSTQPSASVGGPMNTGVRMWGTLNGHRRCWNEHELQMQVRLLA